MQGEALDPVAEDDIDPDPGLGRGVQVELFFEQPIAVNLLQVAHRAQVTAQRPDAPAEADAENRRRITGAETRTAPFVVAHVDFSQRARQAAGVEQGQEVLAKGIHRLELGSKHPNLRIIFGFAAFSGFGKAGPV